jgi:hypothetical protein
MLERGDYSVCIAVQTTWGLRWTSGTLSGFTQSTLGFLCPLSIHRHSLIYKDPINVAICSIVIYKDEIFLWGQRMHKHSFTHTNTLQSIVFVSMIKHCNLYRIIAHCFAICILWVCSGIKGLSVCGQTASVKFYNGWMVLTKFIVHFASQ